MNKIKPFENYSNTIFDRDPGNRDQTSIFVSIVSYRDKNIVDTVRSLYANAKRPNNIYVSICIASIGNHEIQWSGEEDLNYIFGMNKNIRIKRVEAGPETTIGYLRSIANSSYNKEMYYMSVSSSSEFDPHWDDILIKSYDCVYELSKKTDFIFTSLPRFFTRNDDVIDGFVFYTNHKTKISMQREKRDSSRIPLVGYSDFINFDDLSSPYVLRKDKKTAEYIEKLVYQQRDNLDFYKKNGYPIMGYRDFFDNESIALSFGFSSKFAFGDARTILKNNPSDPALLDDNQNDFMSMLNFIDSEITMYCLRWTPVYYMPDYSPALGEKRKSPLEMINDDEKIESSKKIIDKKVSDLSNTENLNKREIFNALCGIDWELKEFKLSRAYFNSTICNSVNCFISLYNFSVNENSLHWNMRG